MQCIWPVKGGKSCLNNEAPHTYSHESCYAFDAGHHLHGVVTWQKGTTNTKYNIYIYIYIQSIWDLWCVHIRALFMKNTARWHPYWWLVQPKHLRVNKEKDDDGFRLWNPKVWRPLQGPDTSSVGNEIVSDFETEELLQHSNNNNQKNVYNSHIVVIISMY